MKKVIQQSQKEVAEFVCDKHQDRKACGHVKLHFWYGSQYDLHVIEADVCDECGQNLIEYLKQNFGTTLKEYDLYE